MCSTQFRAGVKVLNRIMLILSFKAEVRPSLTSTEVRCAPVLREAVEFKAPYVNTKISVVIRGHRFGTQSERHNNTAAPTTAGNFLKARYGPTIAHYSCLQQLLLELCETKMCPKGNVEEQCVKWRQEFLQVRLWTVIPLEKTLKIYVYYGSTLFYKSCAHVRTMYLL